MITATIALKKMRLTRKANSHIREATQVADEFKGSQTAHWGHDESAEHYVVGFFPAKLFFSLKAYYLIELLSNEEKVGDAASDLRRE